MSKKNVEVVCPYTIERNPQDFIREQKKALLALQLGIERAIVNEIARLKGIRERAIRGGQVGGELHTQTSLLLDYLHQQLYQLFPDRREYALPKESYSESVIRAFVGQLTLGNAKTVLPLQKQTSLQRFGRVPRPYRVWIILIVVLFILGLVAVMLWVLL